MSVVKILENVYKGKVDAYLSASTIAEIAVDYYLSGDEERLEDFLLHTRPIIITP
jgi:hypothetical protein